MSLNRMPGLGKSGMSRMYSRRSIVAGLGIDLRLPILLARLAYTDTNGARLATASSRISSPFRRIHYRGSLTVCPGSLTTMTRPAANRPGCSAMDRATTIRGR